MTRDVTGRVPPHDLDLEAAVLSAAILDPDARADVLAACSPGDCYSDANARILGAVVELSEAREPVDLITLVRHLRARELFERVGGVGYLNQIADATPSLANAGAHARRVRQLAVRRRIVAEAQRVVAEGYGEVGDEDAWATQAGRRIGSLADDGRACAEAVPLRAAIRTALNEKMAAMGRGDALTGIATGFERLDRLTSGLHDGETTIVGARPGMGKTSFLLDVIRSVSALDGGDTHGVIMFSLEMPKEQLAERVICAESGVDLLQWRSGRIPMQSWTVVHGSATKLERRPVWIVDAASQSVPDMEATARKIARQWCDGVGSTGKARRVSLVAVDYLQLARAVATSRNASREQEVAEVSRGLKRLAKDQRVPVMALAQVNRTTEDGKDKRPGLRHLRESGSIEQDADNILLLHRGDYYERDATKHTGIAEVIVAKQRNGPTGRANLRWNASSATFQNLARGEHEEDDE
ncbi:MAG: replicative DNA helicase [Gaiellales bacterium]